MVDKASTSLGRQQRRALDTAKGILLDWDGCIAVGDRLLPLAGKLIAQHAARMAIVSNNSTHLPGDFEEMLAQQGVHFPRDRIFLAGAEAIHEVAAQQNARVLLLSVQRMRSYAREVGMTLVRQKADLVLLMRDVNFTYGKLRLAANALHSGARLVVANADATHPGPDDGIEPETGALLAALQACSGETALPPTLIGKPAPPALRTRLCPIGRRARRDGDDRRQSTHGWRGRDQGGYQPDHDRRRLPASARTFGRARFHLIRIA